MLVMRENWKEAGGEDKQTEENTHSPIHTMAQEMVSEIDYSNNFYFMGLKNADLMLVISGFWLVYSSAYETVCVYEWPRLLLACLFLLFLFLKFNLDPSNFLYSREELLHIGKMHQFITTSALKHSHQRGGKSNRVSMDYHTKWQASKMLERTETAQMMPVWYPCKANLSLRTPNRDS